MGIYKVPLPILIETGIRKKEKNYINLNQYKGWYFKKQNNIKRLYTEQVGKLLDTLDLPKFTKVKLSYTVHYPTKRSYDVDNICAISSKFFQDTLVVKGYLEDDNFKVIPEIHYYYGESDKENPRVDCIIEEIK